MLVAVQCGSRTEFLALHQVHALIGEIKTWVHDRDIPDEIDVAKMVGGAGTIDAECEWEGEMDVDFDGKAIGYWNCPRCGNANDAPAPEWADGE
jgi:hypothetical protein